MRNAIYDFLLSTGVMNITMGQILMLAISLVLLYLGIYRKYEPLLLVPIAFGMELTPSGIRKALAAKKARAATIAEDAAPAVGAAETKASDREGEV